MRDERTVGSEIEEITQRREDHARELENLGTQIGSIDQDARELEERFTRSERTAQETSDRWSQAQDDLTASRVVLGQVGEQYSARQRERSHLSIVLDESRSRHAGLRENVGRRTAAIDQYEASIVAADEEIASGRQGIARVEAEHATLQGRIEEGEEALGTAREQLELARRRGKQLERDQHALELSRREAEVHRENTEERSLEELGIDLVESYPAYARSREEGEDAGETGRLDRDTAEARVAELREEIKALGNVNLDAIDEESNLEERNEDLVAQVEDIDAAHPTRAADRRTRRQLPGTVRTDLQGHPRELRQPRHVPSALPGRQCGHHPATRRARTRGRPRVRHRDHR